MRHFSWPMPGGDIAAAAFYLGLAIFIFNRGLRFYTSGNILQRYRLISALAIYDPAGVGKTRRTIEYLSENSGDQPFGPFGVSPVLRAKAF